MVLICTVSFLSLQPYRTWAVIWKKQESISKFRSLQRNQNVNDIIPPSNHPTSCHHNSFRLQTNGQHNQSEDAVLILIASYKDKKQVNQVKVAVCKTLIYKYLIQHIWQHQLQPSNVCTRLAWFQLYIIGVKDSNIFLSATQSIEYCTTLILKWRDNEANPTTKLYLHYWLPPGEENVALAVNSINKTWKLILSQDH